MRYIDSHAHLYASQFDDDRDELFLRMREAHVGALVVGVGSESNKQAITLAQERDEVLGAVVGIHPVDTGEVFVATEYDMYLASGAVVGIGECGFDYFHTSREDSYVYQRAVFEAQVAYAIENELPLMLHVRDKKGSDTAHNDTIEVLRVYQKEHGEAVCGNVHFYTHTKEIARAYLELGFTISFPGVVTFVPELQEVVRDVPGDMMLVESDAPYAAPIPHRGKRNEPVFVLDTIQAIAHMRGEDSDVLGAKVYENTLRTFPGMTFSRSDS